MSGLVCQVKHEVLMEVCLNSVAVFLTSSAQAAGGSLSDWCHSIHTVYIQWHSPIPQLLTGICKHCLAKACRLSPALHRNAWWQLYTEISIL